MIQAIPTNERAVTNWSNIQTSFVIDNDDVRLGTCVEVIRRYNIEVKLGASALISQHNFDHIGRIVTNVKRGVIEELYGEFRKPLIDLEFTIASGDQQEALEKVRKLYRDMFGEIK
jgi:hypothetical protein